LQIAEPFLFIWRSLNPKSMQEKHSAKWPEWRSPKGNCRRLLKCMGKYSKEIYIAKNLSNQCVEEMHWLVGIRLMCSNLTFFSIHYVVEFFQIGSQENSMWKIHISSHAITFSIKNAFLSYSLSYLRVLGIHFYKLYPLLLSYLNWEIVRLWLSHKYV